MKYLCVKYLFIAFLFALLIGCKDNIEYKITPESSTKNIFIIIGQSNAAGRADSSVVGREMEEVLVLGDSEWVQAGPELNIYSNTRNIYKKQGLNFGYSFAKSYIEEHKEPVRIICNAKGATNIYYWQKGSEGYQKTLDRILPFKDDILAILFHQGEKDAKTGNLNWVILAVKMVVDFREDLGFDVPFLFGEISHNNPLFDRFNDDILNLHEYVDGVHIVSSLGIKTKDDNVHFSATGQLELGERYFSEYNKATLRF